mmetsp:Transcript_8463/g.26824  ORF Transcript_8463/g.26824 Transcript_8463/m.26824 type:complete len:366 (-) Transcript_8463:350-1447(-)
MAQLGVAHGPIDQSPHLLLFGTLGAQPHGRCAIVRHIGQLAPPHKLPLVTKQLRSLHSALEPRACTGHRLLPVRLHLLRRPLMRRPLLRLPPLLPLSGERASEALVSLGPLRPQLDAPLKVRPRRCPIPLPHRLLSQQPALLPLQQLRLLVGRRARAVYGTQPTPRGQQGLLGRGRLAVSRTGRMMRDAAGAQRPQRLQEGTARRLANDWKGHFCKRAGKCATQRLGKRLRHECRWVAKGAAAPGAEDDPVVAKRSHDREDAADFAFKMCSLLRIRLTVAADVAQARREHSHSKWLRDQLPAGIAKHDDLWDMRRAVRGNRIGQPFEGPAQRRRSAQVLLLRADLIASPSATGLRVASKVEHAHV